MCPWRSDDAGLTLTRGWHFLATDGNDRQHSTSNILLVKTYQLGIRYKVTLLHVEATTGIV